jgi:hypothetical protein
MKNSVQFPQLGYRLIPEAHVGAHQFEFCGASLCGFRPLGTHCAVMALFCNKSITTMRTLLRHASTGQYFQSLDMWTPDRDNAYDFGLIGRAMKFARKIRLPDLELILSVDNPEQINKTPFQVFLRKVLRNKRS